MVRKITKSVNKRAKKVTWKKVPTQGLVIITGHRGEGKSFLAA